MSRLLAVLLLTVACCAGACRREAAEEPEPAGPLEGRWRVSSTDIVEYDRQDRVLNTWLNQINPLSYSYLDFTPTDVVETNVNTAFRTTGPYVRVDNEIRCSSPMRSYTITRLTVQHLDLLLRGDYGSAGTANFRSDFTIHFVRE